MSTRLKRTIGVSTFLVVVVAGFLLRPGTEADEDPVWVETAQAVVLPFKQRLMAALKEGLAQGPEAAIDACRIEAPRIADALASPTVRVGRTSHRLRNPANAPKPWMLPILQELRDTAPGERPYRIVRMGDDWIGYAEPIYMQPLCLTCHGSDLSASLRDRLDAAYPQDQATGFAVGDFRGIFWVELETRGAASHAAAPTAPKVPKAPL